MVLSDPYPNVPKGGGGGGSQHNSKAVAVQCCHSSLLPPPSDNDYDYFDSGGVFETLKTNTRRTDADRDWMGEEERAWMEPDSNDNHTDRVVVFVS